MTEHTATIWKSTDINQELWTATDWQRARNAFEAHENNALTEISEWDCWDDSIPESIREVIDYQHVYYPQTSSAGNEVVCIIVGAGLHYIVEAEEGLKGIRLE